MICLEQQSARRRSNFTPCVLKGGGGESELTDHQMTRTLVLAVFLAVSPLAVRAEEPLTTSKLWKFSAVALVGATSFDAASSWGKYERNPLLQSPAGTFGARGALIKAGLAGLSVGLQYAFRRHPSVLKSATVLNLVQAGVYTGVAVHNLGIPRPAGLTTP
jgi:hypothetical protein